MVRVIETKFLKTGLAYKEFAGLSTDTKPTEGLATGSVFITVDTGKAYLYDEVGQTWTEV